MILSNPHNLLAKYIISHQRISLLDADLSTLICTLHSAFSSTPDLLPLITTDLLIAAVIATQFAIL